MAARIILFQFNDRFTENHRKETFGAAFQLKKLEIVDEIIKQVTRNTGQSVIPSLLLVPETWVRCIKLGVNPSRSFESLLC